MKAPLIILTTAMVISALDSIMELGLSGTGFYTLLGLAMIGSVIWMWVVVAKE